MLQFKKILLAVFFTYIVFNVGNASPQFSPEVDSLIKLAEEAEGKDAAKYNNNVCWKIRNSNPEFAIQFAMRAIELAKEYDNNLELVKGYSYIGVCHRNLGNYSDALEYYYNGISEARKYQVKDQEGYGYVNLGNLYVYQKNFKEAARVLEKAKDLAIELQDSAILAYAYLNMGRTELGLCDYDAAESFFMKAIDIRTKCTRLNSQRVVIYKYLADCHAEAGLVGLARKEYNNCLKDIDIVNDYDLLSDITLKLAQLFYDEKKYNESLALAVQSLNYSKRVGSKPAIMNCYNLIADIYYRQNRYQDAAENYKSQIACNDSIFNAQLQQKNFNIQYSAEAYKKQSQINLLAQEKKTQRAYIYGLASVVGLIVLLAVLLLRHNNKIRGLNKVLYEQKDELAARNDFIEKQKEILLKQKTQIDDSISYARRIQTVLMPGKEEFADCFSDRFVYYNPKNIVSGDFYWESKEGKFDIIVVADCTGHGVPGAFMSMLGICALHEIVGNTDNLSSSEVLEKLRSLIKTLLKQTMSVDSTPKDGMDIAIVVVDKENQTLEYSGGNIPLIYIRNGELVQLQPTRNPIGIYRKEIPFEAQTLQLCKGDRIYMSSDGYSSQFGGADRQKIKMSGYKDILLKSCTLPMSEQVKVLEDEFNKWKGNLEQIDDILVVGLEV